MTDEITHNPPIGELDTGLKNMRLDMDNTTPYIRTREMYDDRYSIDNLSMGGNGFWFMPHYSGVRVTDLKTGYGVRCKAEKSRNENIAICIAYLVAASYTPV